MITYREQPIADIIETELWPLLVDHREELTTNKALMKLNPDVERYRHAEETGYGLSIVARDGVQIVGYSINFIAPNIHYKDVLMVYNDALWTEPAYRAQIGADLMTETETAARAHGAQLMAWHAKPGTTLDRILQIEVRRKRARVQDIVYTREL